MAIKVVRYSKGDIMATRKWMKSQHGHYAPLTSIMDRIDVMAKFIAKHSPSKQLVHMIDNVKREVVAVYNENGRLHEVSTSAVSTISELYSDRFIYEQVLMSIASIVDFESRHKPLSIEWCAELCNALGDIEVATTMADAIRYKKKGKLVVIMNATAQQQKLIA